MLAIPGSTWAWDLPLGGLWIGLPLAVAAIVLGLRARQAGVGRAMATAAIVIAGLCIAQMADLHDRLDRQLAAQRCHGAQAPWHFLNFLPDPHQHGSLRPICSFSSSRRCSTKAGWGSSSSTP